ncbi:hypothetical protein Ancab_032586 [Ancistrocladus abbreviatus]
MKSFSAALCEICAINASFSMVMRRFLHRKNKALPILGLVIQPIKIHGRIKALVSSPSDARRGQARAQKIPNRQLLFITMMTVGVMMWWRVPF